MGMNRETYERKSKELFAYITELVEGEVNKWRNCKIEVRKNQVAPDKFIYLVEWRGRPLNAFVLESRKDEGGYPYILLYYDHRIEEIYRIHRKIGKKLASLLFSLRYFIEGTITAEAKRIALQQGLFAGIKGGDLFVHIGDYEFQLAYLQSDNSWLVRCDDLHIGDVYKCGDCHPLEFLSNLLRALVLRHLL
jgi:hypothetical protein